MTQELANKKSINWSEICSYLVTGLVIALNCSLTVSWIAIIALMVLAIIKNGPKQFLRNCISAPFMVPILVFVLVSLVSGFFAGGLKEAVATLATGRGFIVYPVLYQILDNQKCVSRGFFAWLAVGAFCGIFAMIQGVFDYHPFTTYKYLQATGFLSSPMSFAGIMQLTSFMALGHIAAQFALRKDCSTKTLGLSLVLVVFNFVGLLFAAERSAWLGMVAGIMALTLRISRKAILIGLLTLTIAGAAGYFVVPVVKTRVNSALNWQTDESIKARIEVWQVALDTFKSHPVLGVGPRNFPHIVNDAAIVPGQSHDLNHGHSNYMHLLATLGIVGILSFAWLLVAPLVATWRSALTPAWPDGISLGLMAALVSLMVAGIFEYNFGSGQVRLAEWFCLAFYRPRK